MNARDEAAERYEQTLGQLDAWARTADDQLRRARAVAQGLALAAPTVTSPTGDVTVALDAHGLLRSVTLSERALRGSMTALGQQITATARAALAQLPEMAAAAAAEAVGEDDVLVRSVRSRFADETRASTGDVDDADAAR